MSLRILPLPAPADPVQALIRGVNAGASLYGQYVKNKMGAERAQYLPQALKTANKTAQARLDALKINNQYQPQLLEGRVQAENIANQFNPQIMGARAALLNEQAQELPQMSQAKLALLNSQGTGANLKNRAFEQALANEAQGAGKGYTITANGVTIPVAPSPASPAMAKKGKGAMGAPDGLIMSPGAPSSTYTTQGNTLIDPKTGQALSVPALKTVENIQQSLVGEPNAQDYLGLMYHQIAPELGGFAGPVKRGIGALKKNLGYQSPQYAAYVAATSSGAINALDQQLQASGLNKNSSMYEHIKRLVTPDALDTPETYAMKIAEAQEMLAERTQNNQQFLKGGIPLQGQPGGYPLAAKVHQQYLKLIGQHYANQKATGNPNFDAQKWLSTVKNAQEFEKTYAHLSPSEKAAVNALAESGKGEK